MCIKKDYSKNIITIKFLAVLTTVLCSLDAQRYTGVVDHYLYKWRGKKVSAGVDVIVPQR